MHTPPAIAIDARPRKFPPDGLDPLQLLDEIERVPGPFVGISLFGSPCCS
jgi:hypothetical protein